MYQNTIIIGNLGRDPEMRYTPSGVAVTNFSVAVNEKWTDRDGQPQERTVWFRVAAWSKLAEVCNQYLSKGRQVFVEGRVNASVWTPTDGGDPRASLELTARTVKFLGRREGAAYDDSQGPPAEVGEDAIPF